MTEAHLREASRMVDLFSDPLRLRMIGKLVESSWTVAALAAELKVKPRSVARHIRNLDEAGLVLHSDDRPTEYRFATERLRRIAAELRPDTPDEFEDSVSGDAIVLRRFVSDGQLARLPSQRNHWLIIPRWLAERFEAGRDLSRIGSQRDPWSRPRGLCAPAASAR